MDFQKKLGQKRIASFKSFLTDDEHASKEGQKVS